MNISKISKTLLFSLLIIPVVNPVLGKIDINLATNSPTPTPTPTATIVPIKLTPGLMGKIKLNVNIGKRAWLNDATVATINGNTLTVAKDNVIYTIITDSNTTFKRKFGGKSSLSEISVNDRLNILGKWNNEEKTEIKATHIRNLSVQKKFATFFGEIKMVNGNTFLVTTAKRGDQTVTITDSTKLVNRKMETITAGDIEVGHRIRIKGLWDSVNKTVTEVKQIKDFTIPVVKPSPTPTAMP